MPTYQVKVRKTVYLVATVELEAETEGHACRDAEALAAQHTKTWKEQPQAKFEAIEAERIDTQG
jgi:hypothetical protein